MSTAVSTLPTPQSSRLRSLVLPREHGAWGILLVPLVAGAWIGHPSGERVVSLLFLLLLALGLFCLRTPAEAWLSVAPLRAQNTLERRAIYVSALAYASVVVFSLAFLLWREQSYGLFLLGVAAAMAFAAQVVLRSMGRQTRMDSQWAGAIALTSTAPAAYYIASGRLDSSAFIIWAANWLFAANQIHYVQVRIRSARAATLAERFVKGQNFLLGQSLMVLILLFAWRSGWLAGLSIVAFCPALVRGLTWLVSQPRRLEVHRLGLTELAHAIAFGALFIVGFQS
jgi:hypothetical protein